MRELTSRERLTRLFNGQEIDRVPIWLLAPFHPVTYYADIYKNPSYRELIPYIDRYCDTFNRRNYNSGFCFNKNPHISTLKEIKQLDNRIERNEIIRYKDLEFKKSIIQGKDGSRVKYFIESSEDLGRILEIPYIPPIPDISQYEKEKEELGDRGLMMVDVGDPLISLYHLMSAEEFSIASLVDYENVLGFLDEMYQRVYAYYKYFLDRGIGEIFFIVGAEFAGPPLVAPNKFNEMSAKYVKGIVDLIRSYGKKSIVHYHGQLKQVLTGMKEIGCDGLHTIEAPPIGDCTLTEAREVLEDMILIGNIQYDDIVRKEPEEIIAMTKEAIEEGKSGRFILSPSAGPYEETVTAKTIENYKAFIDTGIKYGVYK